MNPQSLFRIVFLVILIMLTGFVIFYYTQPEFPIRRVIKNTEGKSIDVLIVGKVTDTIYLDRMPDKTRFSLALDQLAFKDKTFLSLLKDDPPPPEKAAEAPEFSDSYIQNRVAQIKALKDKLEVMRIEADSGTLSPILQNDSKRRIEDLEKEIKSLEVSIETRRYQLKKE